MSYTEDTHAATGGLDQSGVPRGGLLARVALSTLFLLSSFPLGIFWFIVLTTLLLCGLSLTIVWVGLPILALAFAVCMLGAGTERWRLATLLDIRLSSPYRPLPHSSLLPRARARVTDPAIWRALLYLFLLLPAGLVELLVVLALAFSAALVTYPLWFWALPDGVGVQWPGFVADTAPEALVAMLAGCVAATVAAAFVLGASRAHAALGRVMLGPRSRERLE